jgi:hypothetical protein
MRELLTPRLSKFCPHAPTERQSIALVAHRFLPDNEPSEVFYGGAAGGGKSDWLLMGALEYVDVPGYAAIIFRKTFTDLALPGAIMARSREWLVRFEKNGVRWNDQLKQWAFPSGASIQFAYMDHALDELRYQSAEFQYVAFDELTQFPEAQYTYLFSRLRRPSEGPLSKVPLRMRAASNPGGVGHQWVKRRFPIDGKPRGRRVFIPAKLADNEHVDAVAYRAGLSHLGETLRLQLELGDWKVAEGLAYQVLDEHIVDDFALQNSHDRFEAADYGLNGAPWCLWAVDYEGNMIAYDLLYERDKLPSQLAPLVLDRRRLWRTTSAAVMDPSVWHRTGNVNKFGDPAMLSDEFHDNGVAITKANNDPRAGMIRLRELLKIDPNHRFPPWHPRAGEPGAPRMFFHRERCAKVVEELESAPLQPLDKADGGEKVDPAWESQHGHAAAMCRYAAMTRPSPSSEPYVGGIQHDKTEQQTRSEWLREQYDRRKPRRRKTFFA